MRVFVAALALIAAACAPVAKTDSGWATIEVTQRPAAPTMDGVGAKFGVLTFRGGVQLTSTQPNFGGWSSIKIAPDGRLIAISDAGSWLSAQIVTDAKSGDFTGITDVKLAFIRGEDGKPLGAKENADAEGLALLPDGRFAVSFEQRHRIELFDLTKKGPTAASIRGPYVPSNLVKANEGLEALVATPDGDVIGGTEYAPPGIDSSVFYRFKIGAAFEKSIIGFGAAQTRLGNALVDMDRLPNGDYVALERFYFPGVGNKGVIRTYPAAGLKSDPPVLNGPELADWATPMNVDNFEGLAAAALPGGGVRLYVISDNNFSDKQKTLLYAFDMAAPAKPAP